MSRLIVGASTTADSTALPNWLRFSRSVSAENLLLLTCLFFVATFNLPFWRSAIQYQGPTSPGNWLDLLLIGAVIACLHFLILLPLVSRLTVKPVLMALLFTGAAASFYSWQYGTYFDVPMINNILETDYRESRELLTSRFVLFMGFFALLPSLVILWLKVPSRPLKATLWLRLRYWLSAFAVLMVALLLSFQSFSTLMRNHKELRYLINPGNVLVSLPRALSGKAAMVALEKQPLGMDAHMVASPTSGKPLLLVLVVGETQRAANWGMDGYVRNTTPRLAARNDLINFSDVTSCGTSTAVSLPCMFSGQSHDDYSDAYAHSHESLLDLVKHAGVGVEWIDNQSGCKGVCAGVETDSLTAIEFPDQCPGGGCLDSALLVDLKDELEEHDNNQMLILHMMGSHGPAYYQRYPQAMRQFTPTCDSDDLSHCSRQEVVNSYDNSILYTDSVLNQMVEILQDSTDHDTALIYVSDHGESLGELGVYLHGLPYMIAPPEQTHVPMVWWLSEGFQRHTGIDSGCLRDSATAKASHDNVFHSVIGLLGIETSAYNADLDLSQACQNQLTGIRNQSKTAKPDA